MIDPDIKNRKSNEWKIEFHFIWFDLWVGFYYNPTTHVLYFCPLPMIVFKIQFPRKVSDI